MLFKWKPPSTNSIDFAVRTSKDSNQWELFITDTKGHLKLFDLYPAYKSESVYLHNVPVDGQIVEFSYDFETKSVVPLRIRTDKLKPNFIGVALDIWKSMIDKPIFLENLLSSPWNLMRVSHNNLKSDLISTIMSENLNVYSKNLHVLDLACGRGGDIWKWNRFDKKIESWVGVDTNESLLKTAQERISTNNSKLNIKTSLFNLDLTKTHSRLPWQKQKFNIVSCQFALHYFFQSKETFSNFFNLVEESIVEDGLFISTLFDGFEVFNLLLKNTSKTDKYNIEPKFNLDMGLDEIRKMEFGIGVDVTLMGDDDLILSNKTTEYLVFCDIFIRRMLERGWILVKTDLFDIPGLLGQESVISKMNRSYIFQRRSKKLSNKQVLVELTHKLMNIEDTTNVKLIHSSFDSLSVVLHLLTGNIPYTNKNDMQEMTDYYNCILVKWNESQDPIIYKPNVIIEDTKTIWFDGDGPYKIYATKNMKNDKVLLSFSSSLFQNEPICTDTFSNTPEVLKEDLVNLTLKLQKTLLAKDTTSNLKDLFLTKSFGKGKNSWSVKDLIDFVKTNNLPIPTRQKKQELIIQICKHFNIDN